MTESQQSPTGLRGSPLVTEAAPRPCGGRLPTRLHTRPALGLAWALPARSPVW